LGVDPTAEYESLTIKLAPGEVLTIYTDGITEAMNAENKLYGYDRLLAQITQAGGNGVTTLGKAILDDVGRYCGTRPQTDDRCLICFGRKK
jgi:serine phosphatase RsbU (regulator of sigma subunit)